ncbi:GntR family transcriptional regulator [Primorskyibacter flagellatus]|uniref:GntR family transcriptional regulator n=1 Tax=Primorskyibacter flagellatus TaxID=1387277 RepID=A0A917EKZ7_9RHOB|nr:FCD domain-containing protein [Primorskyibacter flagellatus]GGE51176.1 GntR family transcriptional regulator [Primorskyibacter flagellatus]
MEDLRFNTDGQAGDTVGEIAYRRIRSHVVNGRLRPGEKLKLDRMKETYGASVTTLREILNRLAVEELVSAEGQRGFRVSEVSAGELRELGALRALLEAHALRASIERGDLEWEASVVAAHYKLSVVERELMARRPGGVDRWVSCDWGFHNATIAACGQPVLLRTYASIFDRFARYHMLALDFRGQGVVDDHVRLRDLVIGRDADGAIALLTRHIESGVQHVLGTGQFD